MTAANKEISKQAIKNKQEPNTLRNRKKRLIKKAKRNARKSEGDIKEEPMSEDEENTLEENC